MLTLVFEYAILNMKLMNGGSKTWSITMFLYSEGNDLYFNFTINQINELRSFLEYCRKVSVLYGLSGENTDFIVAVDTLINGSFCDFPEYANDTVIKAFLTIFADNSYNGVTLKAFYSELLAYANKNF